MKIYTKTGDEGNTGLYGGKRVGKDSARIIAYGEVDELNACLGLAIAESKHEPIKKALQEAQSTLFTLGAQMASPKGVDPKVEVITAAHVDALERQIDAISETLPPMRHFILPGGTKTSAMLHMGRTICRRAERSAVHLNGLPDEEVDCWVLTYLNRLSDFLFVLARLANQLENVNDIPWLGSKASDRKNN